MTFPVYLIGYMGAGKTTAGRLLAEQLGWYFVDLDAAFAEIHGYTPAEYIRTFGLEAFRKKEKYVLEDLAELPYENVIYATGGGYPCWEDNMDCLKELGTSIYLRWQPEHIAQRLMLTDLSERPVLQGKTQDELLAFITPQLAAREPFYAQADYIIDVEQVLQRAQLTEQDDEQLAQALYQLIHKEV